MSGNCLRLHDFSSAGARRSGWLTQDYSSRTIDSRRFGQWRENWAESTVQAQSTQSRISSKTAAQQPTTTVNVDPRDLALNGELADARAFNLSWTLDPHDFAAGLPGLLHDPNEYDVLRDKPVFGLTGDWDPLTPGVQNVRNQIDVGINLAGSEDGVITWGFYDFHRKVGPNSNGEHKAFFPFTDAQKAAAVISIRNWDELIAHRIPAGRL